MVCKDSAIAKMVKEVRDLLKTDCVSISSLRYEHRIGPCALYISRHILYATSKGFLMWFLPEFP